MAVVTVFRRVPPPVIGVLGVVRDRNFEAFEERLDWLEAIGLLVERFDPGKDLGEVAARPDVRALLDHEGDRCLPLLLVDEEVVSRRRLLSRTELARAVGLTPALRDSSVAGRVSRRAEPVGERR